MITKVYKDHLKKINQKFDNKNIYGFEPNISNDFEKDKVVFSNFWKDCLAENKKDLRSVIDPFVFFTFSDRIKNTLGSCPYKCKIIEFAPDFIIVLL